MVLIYIVLRVRDIEVKVGDYICKIHTGEGH